MSTPPPGTALAQSLGRGTAGTALLPIERAQRGLGSWQEAHTMLTSCTRDLIDDEDAALYFGAPAAAFALHSAAAGTHRYARALEALDAGIAHLTRTRLDQAHARIDRAERPLAAEFDLFYGLTGLGAYLLLRHPDAPITRDVLSYLVRLTWPLDGDTDQLPGWWTPLGPSGKPSPDFPGGQGNFGMAHGVGGILSLLSSAARQGITVEGQIPAVERICVWLDFWRQEAGTGPWWPQWITLAEHRAGTVTPSGPGRPSWCYGIPGLVRAQQLAALALNDNLRQQSAEQALLSCLDDPGQLSRIREAGICHGAAGLLHTVNRVAHDARTDAFATRLPRLRALLAEQETPAEDGFLDGITGPALTLLADETHGQTASGWDACLLAG